MTKSFFKLFLVLFLLFPIHSFAYPVGTVEQWTSGMIQFFNATSSSGLIISQATVQNDHLAIAYLSYSPTPVYLGFNNSIPFNFATATSYTFEFDIDSFGTCNFTAYKNDFGNPSDIIATSTYTSSAYNQSLTFPYSGSPFQTMYIIVDGNSGICGMRMKRIYDNNNNDYLTFNSPVVIPYYSDTIDSMLVSTSTCVTTATSVLCNYDYVNDDTSIEFINFIGLVGTAFLFIGIVLFVVYLLGMFSKKSYGNF